tara:strand:- start:35624 stop:36655 length:1032 start_codon:yes stop_codon:yes gene_type:complete
MSKANDQTLNSATKRDRDVLGPTPEPKGPIRIGVSACIVGQEVRFNGGHKRSDYVCEELGARAEFVPVCPEVEMGLTVPRETLRLVRKEKGGAPILFAPKSGTDHTAKMEAFAARRVEELSKLDLCGFIVQKGSPSCGMERVKAYSLKGGMPDRDARGLFTRELMRRMPQLPVEEDGRLNDPVLRNHFVERVFAHRRLKDLFAGAWTPRELVEFHSREKLLVLAHSDYRPLGRLVAHRGTYSQQEWGMEYQRLFMEALAKPSTVKRHVNVLQHVAGYFRKGLDAVSRHEVAELIEAYRNRLVPLVVPLTLIRHHARSLELSYLNVQTYLHGQPLKLMPQNHLA